MKLPEFIRRVDDLVAKWATKHPRAGLEEIFNQVRDDVAWQLATDTERAKWGIQKGSWEKIEQERIA